MWILCVWNSRRGGTSCLMYSVLYKRLRETDYSKPNLFSLLSTSLQLCCVQVAKGWLWLDHHAVPLLSTRQPMSWCGNLLGQNGEIRTKLISLSLWASLPLTKCTKHRRVVKEYLSSVQSFSGGSVTHLATSSVNTGVRENTQRFLEFQGEKSLDPLSVTQSIQVIQLSSLSSFWDRNILVSGINSVVSVQRDSGRHSYF